MQIVHPGGNEKISLYNNVDYEENAASKFILAITTRINNKAVASLIHRKSRPTAQKRTHVIKNINDNNRE